MLKRLLFFTCFLSLAVPRSGTKIGPIPLAIPSLLFALLIGLWFLNDAVIKKRLPKTVISGPVLAYLCWGLIAGLRSIGSADFADFFNFTIVFVIFPLGFFLIAGSLRARDQLRYFLNIITAALVIVCLYGFVQFLVGFQKVTIPGVTMCYSDFFVPDILNLKRNVAPGPAGQKMFSTFHNGNLLGQHLVTFIPIIIVMFFETKTRLRRLLFSGIGILAIGALVCTLSRGAVAGFLTSLIFLFLITRRKYLKIFCAVAVAAAVLTGIIFNLKARYVDQTKAEPSGTRLAQWRSGLNDIKQLGDKGLLKIFLFGTGLGGEVRGVKCFYSTYLTIWLDMGLIGLGLFIWIIFNIFRTCLIGAQLTKDPVILIFLVGGMAGILGALVHMSVDTLFLFPPIAQNFWMLLGLMAIAVNLAPKTQDANQ